MTPVSAQHFRRFGDSRVVALYVRLLADPDPEECAPASAAGSWGEWQLWVAGLNLTEAELPTGGAGASVKAVRWYLAPLFRWIVNGWEPLFHESRLPTNVPNGLTAVHRSHSALSSDPTDDDLAEWFAWMSRHCLRSAADGGILPDIYFQRVDDEIEVSWSDRTSIGSEGVRFLLEPGAARVPVRAMADVFDLALRWFTGQSSLLSRPWMAEIRDKGAVRRATPLEARIAWFLDGAATAGPLTRIVRGAGDAMAGLGQVGDIVADRLSPSVAMFGGIAPNISEKGGAALLAVIAEARVEAADAMTCWVSYQPAWQSTQPWDDGYRLAEELLDEHDPDPSAPALDIEGLAKTLGAQVIERELDASGPRGVAIAGDGHRPTIVVNVDHPSNMTSPGRRFTLAHELCHLLHDRGEARPIFHSSSPWAHPAVEKRANAFAMMLLAPGWRVRARLETGSLADLKSSVDTLRRELEVPRVGLIHHLQNIGEISEDERDQLLDPEH